VRPGAPVASLVCLGLLLTASLACSPSTSSTPSSPRSPASEPPPIHPPARDSDPPGATSTAPAPAAEPPTFPPVRQLTLHQVRERARGAVVHLNASLGDRSSQHVPRRLTHAAFAGRMGPFDDAAVWFSGASTVGTLVGWIGAEHQGTRHVWQVAHDTGGAFASVEAILFEDVDEDGSPDPIVIYSWMIGHGPQAAVERTAAVWLRWDGSRFVADARPFLTMPSADAARVRAVLEER